MRLSTFGISLALLVATIAPANAQGIKPGNYWQSNGLQFLEVKGDKFRLSARSGSHLPWEPTSRLKAGKNVVQHKGGHWCLSTTIPSPLVEGARCSAKGRTLEPIWLPKNPQTLI